MRLLSLQFRHISSSSDRTVVDRQVAHDNRSITDWIDQLFQTSPPDTVFNQDYTSDCSRCKLSVWTCSALSSPIRRIRRLDELWKAIWLIDWLIEPELFITWSLDAGCILQLSQTTNTVDRPWTGLVHIEPETELMITWPSKSGSIGRSIDTLLSHCSSSTHSLLLYNHRQAGIVAKVNTQNYKSYNIVKFGKPLFYAIKKTVNHIPMFVI